jgi:transposase
LWGAGNTVEEIAEKIHCSLKTARRWVQKYEMGEADLFQDQR